ncbi:MAG: NAD(P)/FAD-dependent oxidoreductase [Clostridia bacterium]|nr:NAD(P)/FAD-dependent oxidoreductase [Clostridia bacterium]
MADIIVIGGGAAGMMAAVFAARAGSRVTLLEHNEKLGKKIYITGKGRCNVTNNCDTDEFTRQVARNPRFLYSALSHFSPADMMELLEKAGCPVTVQRGRRVFPATEKASDVTRALSGLLRGSGVEILLNTEVRRILTSDGRVSGVELAGGACMRADAVIVATGGKSYPVTGSTGDGYRFAEQAGHTVMPPKPVLSALVAEDSWPCELQGLSLRNVTMTVKQGKKTLYTELGEMLFTHFGISGPLTLEASCHLPDDLSAVQLSIDLKPGLDREQLDARLRREFGENGKKQLRNVMPSLLPGKLAEIFPDLCGIGADTVCNQITGAQREKILSMLKALPVALRGFRPLDEAIVTRGGVNVKEIDPKTMESKLVGGLYFAGEVIDVDAHTGGYNLQIAFSTGALAGTCAGMV